MTPVREAALRLGSAGAAVFGAAITAALALKLMPMSDAAYFAPAALGLIIAILAATLAALGGSKPAYMVFLAVMLVALSINFRIRETGEFDLDFQSAGKLVGWSVAFGIGLWHLARYRDLIRQPHIACMILYCLIACLSVIWSVTPMYSLGNGVGLLGFCLFALAGASLMPAHTLIRGCVASLAIYLAINLASAVVVPDFSFMAPSETETVYRLSGVAGHANVLAQQLSVLLGLLFICHDRKWMGRFTIIVLAAAAFGGLWLTNSRSSLIAVTVSIGLVLLRRRPVLLILVAMAGMLAAMTILAMPDSLLDDLVKQFSRNGSATEIMTINGRTELWAFCIEKIMERPLFGYGNMSGEEVISREFVSSSYGSNANAHNMILQSLLGVGLVGTSILLAIVVWHIWMFIARPDPLRDVFGLMMIISGLTEIEIFGSMASVYALVYFCAIAANAAETTWGCEGVLRRRFRHLSAPVLAPSPA